MDKLLLNIKEICELTGWSDKKVREIIKRPNTEFTLKMGNRLYVQKDKFLAYLDKCSKYNIVI